MNMNKAAERGWKMVTHEVSAEKSGHVFKGRPEDVLARVERFEEHGDFVRVHAEARERQEQHEQINRLFKKLSAGAGEYLVQLGAYEQRRESNLHAALNSLDRATEQLERMHQLWHEVLDFTSEVLLENERFLALRDSLPSDLAV
jgi:hypothetical protein